MIVNKWTKFVIVIRDGVANTKLICFYISLLGSGLRQTQMVNEDNYPLGDLRSDEETDDVDAPRQVIPQWAQGHLFKVALITQAYKKPSYPDIIFSQLEILEGDESVS